MVLRALHLCSGYGGFELALRLAGVPARTVAHVERDAYAAATLVARMEEAHLDRAPVWSDLTTFDPEPWRGRVDLITAGFPCQPFSSAGQQRGVDDERWLWPSIGRLIGDVGPRLVFLENVPGLVRAGLPHVLSDLACLGFDAEWGLFAASEIGAPHQRERFWLLGHAGGSRRPEDPRGAPSDEAAPAGPEAGCCGHIPDGAGEGVADATGFGGLQGHRPGAGRSDGRPVTDAGDTGLADADGAHRQGHRSTIRTAAQEPRTTGVGPDRQWPPGRDDHDGWRHWITQGGPEPAVRRGTDGRPAELADALHLGGNGLVPAVAAAALVELARRLDVDLWEDR